MNSYEGLYSQKLSKISKLYPFIGKGSSRKVFDAGEIVIKYAINNSKGEMQNSTEFDIYTNLSDHVDILCPIFDISKNDNILIMKKVTPLTKLKNISEEDKKEIKRFKKHFNNIKKYYTEKYLYKHIVPEKLVNEVENSELYGDIYTLIYGYDLLEGDVLKLSSWGYSDGKFYLFDYGCTKEQFDRLYRVKVA
ncbi:MAG: hypothetical protein K0R54_255 [Clostridiaceae bacterium]|jgi:hypothetical protein|nr:hypothetical protein [Clostridiaceae bacterium]